jgi:hypothetical protein
MVTIVIPWRPQPSRLAAFDTVVDWYRTHLPEAQIVTIDSEDELFNLSRCRNLGIARVEREKGDGEVVIVGDADTLPQIGALREAVAAATSDGLVHLPYTDYHWLGRAGTADLLAGAAPEDCDFELVRGACSGVYVTTPATWWSHGGQDERFRGWGFEDAAWYVAHETLLGEPPRRHSGAVFAMHHETQLREGPQYDLNAELMQRYRDVAADPAAMRQLVEADPKVAAAAATASNARTLPGV